MNYIGAKCEVEAKPSQAKPSQGGNGKRAKEVIGGIGKDGWR